MANKLKNMKYTSVDLCKRGANPRADIKLMKSVDYEEGGELNVKKSAIQKFADDLFAAITGKNPEDDQKVKKSALEAAAGESFDMTYALHESISSVINDPEMSAVEKSEAMTESLEQFNEDITQSFDDWSEGKSHIQKAEMTEARLEALKKSAEYIGAVIKANTPQRPTSFANAFAMVNVTENMWQANDTLRNVMQNIMAEESITDKKTALNSAIDDYAAFMKEKVSSLTIKKSAEFFAKKPKEKPAVESDDDEPDDDTDEGESILPGTGKKSKPNIKKGGNDIMPKIDIEKMAPEDKAVLEGLQKKYAPEETHTEEPPADSSKINPEVQKALDKVETLTKQLEMSQLTEIAKKYEALGMKSDETAAMLYDLKKSNETAYNSVIAAYDKMVDVQSKSGIFKEIGSNAGGTDSNDLMGFVSEIQKSMPTLTQEQAVCKAFELHPELDPMTGKLLK